MAALTPTAGLPILRESVGSMVVIGVPLTTVSSSDTYTLEAGAPVVTWNAQGNSTSTATTPDVAYNQATGVFTLSSSSQGALTLFILMRT